MKFNLSKFKKLHSDKHTTTLQHPEGHKIVLAHSALSKPMRSELEALPNFDEGGEINRPAKQKFAKPTSQDQKESIRKEEESKPTSAFQDVKQGFKNVKSAFTGKNYADGGSVQDQKKKDAADLGKGATQDALPPEGAWNNLKSGLGLADGGEVADESSQQMPQSSQQSPVTINIGQPPQIAPQNINPNPGAMSAEQAPQPTVPQAADLPYGVSPQAMEKAPSAPEPVLKAPEAPQQAPQPQAAPSPQGDPYGTSAAYDFYTKGLNDQKQGIYGQAIAEGQAGKEQAQALQNSVAQQQAVAQSFKEHSDELMQERKNFMQDYQNQHIDSNHYLASQGTGQKIATAIGLILGGIGGGMSHQENAAMSFLNKQIDRDIEAQRANMGKSQNLLSANMESFKNMRDATDMTRIMQMDIVSNQLKEAAAKSNDPMAKARALQAWGGLQKESASTLGQMAARKTLMSGMANGQIAPERVVNMVVPEAQRAEANKELTQAQSTVSARDNLLASFDRLNELNTLGNRAAHVGFEPPQVKALRDPLLASLSKDTAGRFTEADAGMLKPLFPAPGDSPETVSIKRAQMQKLISEKMHFPILQTYGIDPNKMGRFGAQGQARIQESAPVTK